MLCVCVFRAIFRACYERFRLAVSKERTVSVTSFEGVRCGPGRHLWGLKDEEYTADFCLVARRTLSPRQHRLFRFHYLLGADWKLCCAKENLDRGTFFHEIYRIEQKLGKTFRELRPYALFPLDEYFRSTPRATSYERATSSRCPDVEAPLFPRLGRPQAVDYFDEAAGWALLDNDPERGKDPAPQRAAAFPLKRKRKAPAVSRARESSGD